MIIITNSSYKMLQKKRNEGNTVHIELEHSQHCSKSVLQSKLQIKLNSHVSKFPPHRQLYSLLPVTHLGRTRRSPLTLKWRKFEKQRKNTSKAKDDTPVYAQSTHTNTHAHTWTNLGIGFLRSNAFQNPACQEMK